MSAKIGSSGISGLADEILLTTFWSQGPFHTLCVTEKQSQRNDWRICSSAYSCEIDYYLNTEYVQQKYLVTRVSPHHSSQRNTRLSKAGSWGGDNIIKTNFYL